ncbi:membrane protein [Erwinia typographi]|uniref:Membrane protein n=1 Tax=Erwinia typographi TaxID=371042 RepID=A0A0A3YMV6_9GAMM|nr:hypothetical protein [Erwinia typographi]KGT86671.1 membrane protein [Erwinia typographi]
MDKNHFYERLARWQHLRFNDVVVREHPDTQAWNKQYEIYLLDKTRSSAQLFIRTMQPGEDIARVLAEYLSWLQDYNDNEIAVKTTQDEPAVTPNSRLKESCRRSPASQQPRLHTGGPASRIIRRLP